MVAAGKKNKKYADKIQRQGTRDDGEKWSAIRSYKKMAYQEGGESITARRGQVIDAGKGIHSLCYTNGPKEGECKTEEVVYTSFNWNVNDNKLEAAGLDALGDFTFSGSVQGKNTAITKTWTSGAGGDVDLVATMVLYTLPDDTGLFFGDFDFETNQGVTGKGRFSAAFTDNAQSSFDGWRSLARPRLTRFY